MDMISGLRYQAEKLRKEQEEAKAKAAAAAGSVDPEAAEDDPSADDAVAADTPPESPQE